MQEDLLNDLSPSPELALRNIRWMAAVVDYLIFAVSFSLLSMLFGALSNTNGHTEVNEGFILFWAIWPWLACFPVMEFANKGQTLGKMLFRIKVVNEEGGRPVFGQTLLRHLCDLIDYFPALGILGLIVSASNNSKRRIGDKAGRTYVVKVKKSFS